MTDIDNADTQDSVAAEPVSDITVDDDLQKPIFNKIQMSDVVKRESHKAYEKGRREAMMELQQQQAVQATPQESPQAQPEMAQQGVQNIGGVQHPSIADIERLIAERAPQALQHHVQQAQLHEMVDSFVTKMNAAEQRHPGLESKLNRLNYNDPETMTLIKTANSFENTGDIMKEILDHPGKFGQLLTLAEKQPSVLMDAMAEISNSIKQNQDALAQNAQARDPINQMKPSANAGMDDGKLSVSDFRKMFTA